MPSDAVGFGFRLFCFGVLFVVSFGGLDTQLDVRVRLLFAVGQRDLPPLRPVSDAAQYAMRSTVKLSHPESAEAVRSASASIPLHAVSGNG